MEKENIDKRTAILRATMELISENGFHGAPTSMIATRACVGTGTIYRYFADKDELIKEVFDEVEGRLKQKLETGYPSEQSMRQRLDHYSTGMLHFFIENRMEFKFLGQFYDSPYGVALRRDKIFSQKSNEDKWDTMRQLFEQGIVEGVIKDLPIPVLFAFFLGILISVARDHINGFIDLNGHLLQRTADACWDAIKQ
jgi:TetR/AcrR family transcriptional regulator, repressor of fatR-cypB operon